MIVDRSLCASVRIDRLTKTYGAVKAIENVSMDIEPGEFMTFLGPSGSGKTTTLSIIAGFDDATSGEVFVDGKPIRPVPPHKRNVGMVFQRYTLFPHMTVFDNIAFPLSIRRRSRAGIRSAVERVLALVRLQEVAHRKPQQLSGGQQQRVALARALVYEPRILLMDEPLGALDKKLREEIQAEIRALHQHLAVTILYVTHDQEEALRMSDRIAVFNKGQVVQIGTGDELYSNPRTAFVAGFIGNSNFLKGKVVSSNRAESKVAFSSATAVVTNNGPPLTVGTPALVMVRPEKWTLRREPTGSSDECSLKVTVLDVTFLGDALVYEVTTASGQALSVRETIGSDAPLRLHPGSQAMLSWRSKDAHLFAGPE